MAAETETLPGLHVVQIRYQGSDRALPGSDPVDAYVASGAYQRLGVATVIEPAFPEDRRDDEPTINLGLIGGQIAEAVAAGRRAGKPVLVVGGNCASVPGVVGGLQEAHGPAAKIGLVWFDAHGDFNTPKTTLSGMIGGMPVAVSAGLAFPHWRQITGLDAPIPTDRIVMVDVRNLDPKERTLIEATDVTIAAIEPGREGVAIQEAIDRLAAACDVIYLHIDEDVLDERYVPNHGTVEPNGPDMETTLRAIRTVLRTGKVRGYGLVSINVNGEGGKESLESGLQLLTKGIAAWHQPGA